MSLLDSHDVMRFRTIAPRSWTRSRDIVYVWLEEMDGKLLANALFS